MRLTRQAALAIALIAGLLAALFAWMFIGQQNKPKAKAPETVQIPVPIATIKAGTELQAAMFQLGEQPKEQLTPNIVTDAQVLQGRVAVMELPGGQPVRVEQIRERDVRLGMAWALNPGLRGMAVSLDVVGTVGDFIKPLDHVDVLTAFRQDNQAVVRTLVQDVVVLAIGQTITSAPPATTTEETSETTKEAPPPRKTETPVTLALTPAQAQLILTADQAGDLRLTLRGKGDRSVLPLAPANSWSMVGQIPKPGAAPTTGGAAPSASAASPQPPAATAPAPAPSPVRTAGAGQVPQAGPKLPKQPYVEVVRGSAREIVVPE